MSNTANLETVERCIAAWGRKDAATFLELFSPDIVYDDVPLAKVLRGHDEFKQFYDVSIVAFPDLYMDLIAAVADDTKGAAEWTLSGTFLGETEMMGKPTGKSFEVRGTSFINFDNGKISYLADYWNMVSLTEQLGIG